jgi:hypothetical protein
VDTPSIQIEPRSIANDLGEYPKHDGQGEHHQRRLPKRKRQHGQKYPGGGDQIGHPDSSQIDQPTSLVLDILNSGLFLRSDRLADGRVVGTGYPFSQLR